MATPFNFELSPKNLEGMFAVGSIMNDLMADIKAATQYKPENRLIDCVPILERISATAARISEMMENYGKELEMTAAPATIDDIPAEMFTAPGASDKEI